MATMASRLKLLLSRQISDRPPSHKLPLPLTRNLGTVGKTDNTDDTPSTQPRRMRGAMACFNSTITSSGNINTCYQVTRNGQTVVNCLPINRKSITTINYCNTIAKNSYHHINNCGQEQIGDLIAINQCVKVSVKNFQRLFHCYKFSTVETLVYHHCLTTLSKSNSPLYHCKQQLNSSTIGFEKCLKPICKGQNLHKCHDSKIQQAVAVPCRYYPIPTPPPKPPKRTCRIRPPSHQLPLPLSRAKKQYQASKLPLPLACWHDEPTLPIPNKDTYIMPNTVTATLSGINIDPLSFSIKTDMDSYCWQGSVEISPQDYEKVKAKLDKPRGEEPLINVVINNHQFAIIAEEQSIKRQFVNDSHNLSGRSLTARLGADYAKANNKIFQLASYASQIINEQLTDLPITVEEFAVDDWRIPEGIYSVSDKTPIAVIADIADACGGFVVSHDYDAKLSIKKKWKVNAWELATTQADVILPADAIVVSTKKINKAPRYNVVRLFAIEAKIGDAIYREHEGKDKEASSQTNALFTSDKATIAKGCQILSDSGTHAEYILQLPFTDDVPLAKLGQIWQVNNEQSWKGIVTSVAIDVKVNDGVPIIWQNVTLDNYLDE